MVLDRNNPPTIRQLVIQKIKQLTQELTDQGYVPQLTGELEYMAYDDRGKPINLDHASIEDDLSKPPELKGRERKMSGAPFVEKSYPDYTPHSKAIKKPLFMVTMGAYAAAAVALDNLFAAGLVITPLVTLGSNTINNRTIPKNEITTGQGLGVSDQPVSDVENNHRRSPLYTANALAALKRSIPKHASKYGASSISFDPVQLNGKKTAGIHINASLLDVNGNNLLINEHGRPNALLEACVRGLIDVQNDGLLLTTPSPDSLKRYQGTGTRSIPEKVKHVPNKLFSSTVSARFPTKWMPFIGGNKEKPHTTRAENRLPGSDSDPYRAVLQTLLGIKHGIDLTKASNIDPQESRDFSYNHLLEGGKKIPTKYNDVISRFENSAWLKEELGETLHNALLNEARQKSMQSGLTR